MRLSAYLAPALACALMLSLGGCSSVESRAGAGDYYSQVQLYQRYSAKQPDGKMLDPVKAEYWMGQFTQTGPQYRELYAYYLLIGRFGHIDEDKALQLAMQSPQDDKNAQDIIKDLNQDRNLTPEQFQAAQKLYGELRPLCPDKYAHPDQARDAVLLETAGDADYALLPAEIQHGMPNVDAYIRLAQSCEFTLVEHLSDPKAYAAMADWYEGPIIGKPNLAGAAHAVMQQRFPDGAKTPVAAEPADVILVRAYVLRRYKALYAAQTPTTRITSACYEALLPVNDLTAQKDYAGIQGVVTKAVAGPCSDGVGRGTADQYLGWSQYKLGDCKSAVATDFAMLKDDTYDVKAEDVVISDIEDCASKAKSPADFDAMVQVLQGRYPSIQGLKF